ncbi:TPA: HAD-IIIA family hydrolase [Candidatus Woesearchaeota archaeon]|nr:HAD-IIIA family hydrolase [Candidatus Woesearchaeota archaeon]HII69370.1 HAD-IIIA family hydrolase [Candidatus Woesearchaeota archaeon]
MIRAVLFDLDNTLIDFMKMKRMSCEAAVSAMIDAGLGIEKERAMEELFRLYDMYGLEEPLIFQKFLKATKLQVDYRIIASGVVAYRRVRAGFLEPYPHVYRTLLELKQRGLKLAIVTDAPQLKAWIRLTAMKLADFFDVVITFNDTQELKPSRKPFEKAIEALGAAASECLMVGDWPARDIKGAKLLGMQTAFARYGNPSVKASGADHDLSDVSELLGIIEKTSKKSAESEALYQRI